MTRRHFALLMLSMLLTVSSLPAAARAAEADETVQSAVFLLRSTKRITRDGSHIAMLRATRHLGDPRLTPLFSELIDHDDAILKIHGFLGLAECQPDKKLDLVRIAELKDERLKPAIISAAMDSKVLSDEQAQQLLQWPGLDVPSKVLVAGPLIRAGKFNDKELLREAIKSDNLARRSLASAYLLQIGERDQMQSLIDLNNSTDRERDRVREMLLQSALHFNLDRIGPWALTVSQEPTIRPPLGLLALRVALRFNVEGSGDLWRQRFNSATDPAQRTRLAFLLAQAAEHAEPKLFGTLIAHEDPLVRQIGIAGQAIATKQNIAASMISLVQMHNTIANQWALTYAVQDAEDDDAKSILLGLILAFKDGPRSNLAQRLDDVVAATQALCERDSAGAIPMLRSILSDPQVDVILAQGMLFGMIRAKADNLHEIVTGIDFSKDAKLPGLVIMLLAKQGPKLTKQQLDDLALIVRGGGAFPPPLRLQAAWSYLDRTNQVDKAMAQVLGN